MLSQHFRRHSDGCSGVDTVVMVGATAEGLTTSFAEAAAAGSRLDLEDGVPVVARGLGELTARNAAAAAAAGDRRNAGG